MIDTRLVRIYLSDHLAGSVVGLELAKRCLSNNRGTELGTFLDERLIPEISGDKDTLGDVMRRLGVRGSGAKNALAWTGEKAGRLKFNGTLRRYSPLSRLVEIEGLVVGVTGKLSMWQSLEAVAPDDARLDGVDFARLAARARSQIESLEAHRAAASRIAFAGAGPS
jgi:hypothetical protein